MPHSLSIENPVGCRGRLFHPHGRQMQELVHDLSGHGFDRPSLALVEPSEERFRLLQLGLADLLGARPQRSDRRHDVEGRIPLVELLRLGRDDRLGVLGLPPAEGQGLDDDLLEVVDVVEVTAVELTDRGVEIARNREIDSRSRRPCRAPSASATMAASSTSPGAFVEAMTTSTSARCSWIRLRSVLLFATSVISAPRVRRLRAACSLTLPAPRRRIGAFLEAAEDLLRERSCGGRHRSGALADRGLRAHLPARMERLPEDAIEQRPGRPELVRNPNLAEDLAFARNERIEPCRDAEEMVSSSPVAQAVERGLDLGLERSERRGGSALGLACIGGGDIELRAVAGREAGHLASVLRQPCGKRLRLVAVERNLLAQLDRRVVVRGADEDEMHHAK